MLLRNGDVEIKFQQVQYAQRLFEILNSKKFLYFSAHPKSVKDEEKWLKGVAKKRKNNFGHDFAIIYKGKVVGGVGVKINQHRKWIGEIGYFLDENYWGKGITTKAVKLLEKYCFKKIKLHRIEIIMDPKNTASEKVAIKNKYNKEGIAKSCVKNRNNKWGDCIVYAKINPNPKATGPKKNN